MNTRLLMCASAIFLGVLGASAIFLPQEILACAGTAPAEFMVVLVQIAGALYLGFGMLNWMGRGNIIGGIYSRPVAIGNLAHFTIGALSLLKSIIAGQLAPVLIIGAAAYTIFAVLFALLAFGQPPREGVKA